MRSVPGAVVDLPCTALYHLSQSVGKACRMLSDVRKPVICLAIGLRGALKPALRVRKGQFTVTLCYFNVGLAR